MAPRTSRGQGSGKASRSTSVGRSQNGGGGGRRREQELLEAAIRIFHTRGYADASVQDIANELGILKGSLYHYIDSKEDLLFRIVDEALEEAQVILDEVEALDLPPLERLREYVFRQVDYLSRNLERMAVYHHDADKLTGQRRKETLRKRRRQEAFVTGLIAEAKQRGDVDEAVDPELAANYVFGSMIWIYRWYKPGGKLKPARVAETCADFVMHGVTARPGSRHARP